jgi:hypothetical protein
MKNLRYLITVLALVNTGLAAQAAAASTNTTLVATAKAPSAGTVSTSRVGGVTGNN